MKGEPRVMTAVHAPTIGLFTTCLAETFRPAVIQAAMDLLEEAGCDVRMPRNQTCCGFTALQAHEPDAAIAMASEALACFDGFNTIVTLSPTCSGALKASSKGAHRKILTLTDFLWDECRWNAPKAQSAGTLAYLSAQSKPSLFGSDTTGRRLLDKMSGVHIVDFPDPTDIMEPHSKRAAHSTHLSGLANRIHKSGAGLVVSEDLGLLLSLAKPLKNLGSGVELRHIAEVLAGRFSTAPIGAIRS